MFRSSTHGTDIVLFEMIDAQSPADGAAYIRALDDFAKRSEPAVLIMLVKGMTGQDHETRKQAAAWFKQNRDRLAVFAKGVIRVEQDHHHGDGHMHDHAEDVENSNFARMLPFPMKHAPTLDSAIEMAKNWPPELGGRNQEA
ncbi:hypothetical protein ACQ0MK_11150 [Thalassospira lucentensis]|uniref:hypothetical protein n=1 Tax=Thalassospira lucentensis TaxID=168935 RepID=UPI003D2F4AB2